MYNSLLTMEPDMTTCSGATNGDMFQLKISRVGGKICRQGFKRNLGRARTTIGQERLILAKQRMARQQQTIQQEENFLATKAVVDFRRGDIGGAILVEKELTTARISTDLEMVLVVVLEK